MLIESACSILQEIAKSTLSDLVPKCSTTPATRFSVCCLFLNDELMSMDINC